VVYRGHKYKMSSGKGDVRSDAGALATDRLFSNLDHKILSLMEQIFDLEGVLVRLISI